MHPEKSKLNAMSDELKIWVVAEDDISATASVEGERDGRRDMGGGFGARVTERVTTVIRRREPLDAGALKAQMKGLLTVVGELFDHAEQQTGMRLTEVELKVEINAEGQVSLVGNGGKLGNTGGITLKFTRP
jgi:hypothetical protein